MKNKYLFLAAAVTILAAMQPAKAQVKIGTNPTQIVPGAKLQVDGDNTTTTPAKLIVTGTGNVGVGTAAPGTALDVNGAITNREVSVAVAANAATIPDNAGQVQLTGAATANIALTPPATPANAGQRLIIYNNTTGGFNATLGSVNIINGQAAELIYSNNGWRSTDNGVGTVGTPNNWGLTGNGNTSAATNFIGTTNGADLVTRTGNVERMRVTSAGNVGIGTSSPASHFSVVSNAAGNGTADDMELTSFNNPPSAGFYVKASRGTESAPVNLAANDLVATLEFQGRVNGGINALSSIRTNYLGDGTTVRSNLQFSASGAERMRIDSNGYVGIGTTAPTRSLEIGRSSGGEQNPTIRLQTSGGTYGAGGVLEFRESNVNWGMNVRHQAGDGANGEREGLYFNPVSNGTEATVPAMMIQPGNGSGNTAVAIGTATPNASAALEVSSTNKGFLPPRMTTAERDAISQPASGLLVYNTTLNCLQLNVGTPATPSWQCLVGAGSTATNPTSNGTAAVASYNCSGADAGTLTIGTAASGVTRIITANVTTPGTYNLSATANGITFTGSGSLTATGNQSITLTASGTPIATGTHNYTLNTSPGCSFSRTTNGATSPSSGGSAVVASYDCTGTDAGTLTAGTPASGVTRTITANVTTAGTYNITATASGVTFSGSGTFAGTGNQSITLAASGTPTTTGTASFALSTTPNCSFTRTINNAPSSNGSAVVASYNCSTASAGTLTAGTAASGVTQTITADVTTAGTYSITTTANGVTFSGSGTFAGTGNQNITLTASGTPNATGTPTFTLNTSPGCSFTRTINNAPSSNGTAVVSSYTCNTASNGVLFAGSAVSSVSQTLTANVTTVGTYSISATANGVTFSGSGTFSGTGNQTIVLSATGTPTAAGSHSFALNTTPGCSFTRTTKGSGFDDATACVTATNNPPTFDGVFPAGDVKTYTANTGAPAFVTAARNVQGDCSGTAAATGTKFVEFNGQIGITVDLGAPLAPGSTFTKTFYVKKKNAGDSPGGVRIGVSTTAATSGGAATNALFTIPAPASTTWSATTVTFTVPAGTNWRYLTIEGTNANTVPLTGVDY